MRLPDTFVKVEQPVSEEFACVDDIFVKTMPINQAGLYVPQHAHEYHHISFVARGSVLAWKDGVCMGVFAAPKAIFIEAGAKHTFQSLEPDTLILCIHNTHGEGISIIEEHQLVGSEPCRSDG